MKSESFQKTQRRNSENVSRKQTLKKCFKHAVNLFHAKLFLYRIYNTCLGVSTVIWLKYASLGPRKVLFRGAPERQQ
jgi:hypothetical protein